MCFGAVLCCDVFLLCFVVFALTRSGHDLNGLMHYSNLSLPGIHFPLMAVSVCVRLFVCMSLCVCLCCVCVVIVFVRVFVCVCMRCVRFWCVLGWHVAGVLVSGLFDFALTSG